MPNAPPEHVHPLRLARRGEALEGSVPLAGMARLATLLHERGGHARFALGFGFDDEGQARVLGRIDARPVVLCQRCLEPMAIDVVCEVSLALVAEGTDTAAIAPCYEPLVVDESPQRLSDLVEDEIILALPNFARHRRGECRMPPGADFADGAPPPDDAGEENPFSVLKSLKSRGSS